MNDAKEETLATFKNLCELTDSAIISHFDAVKKNQDKYGLDYGLKHSVLVEELSSKLNIPYGTCTAYLQIYLDKRADVEVRKGKYSGIFLKNDDAPRASSDCVNSALRNYSKVVAIAPEFIKNAFSEVETRLLEAELKTTSPRNIDFAAITLPFKEAICDKIAEQLQIKSYSVYHCMKKYILEERNEDLCIDRGAKGGLRRKKIIKTAAPQEFKACAS